MKYKKQYDHKFMDPIMKKLTSHMEKELQKQSSHFDKMMKNKMKGFEKDLKSMILKASEQAHRNARNQLVKSFKKHDSESIRAST